jgi:alpha-beta hydrolase superfamily lysophospholipase
MYHTEYTFISRDGANLFAQAWQPDPSAKAAIALVHGLGEHSGRYQHVAANFTGAGFVFSAFDLRGHGRSPGARGHINGWEIFYTDIEDFLSDVRLRFPGLPVILYGHSLGGSIVLNFALDKQPSLAALIATSPGLRTAVAPAAPKVMLGKLMYSIYPNLALANGLDRSKLSRDPEVVRAYENDPLVHDRVTARLGLDTLRYGEWALEHASNLSLPLLLMHGDADQITSVEASREFARRAGERCTLKIWNGFYHELHNEPEKQIILSFIVDWVTRILSAFS